MELELIMSENQSSLSENIQDEEIAEKSVQEEEEYLEQVPEIKNIPYQIN